MVRMKKLWEEVKKSKVVGGALFIIAVGANGEYVKQKIGQATELIQVWMKKKEPKPSLEETQSLVQVLNSRVEELEEKLESIKQAEAVGAAPLPEGELLAGDVENKAVFPQMGRKTRMFLPQKGRKTRSLKRRSSSICPLSSHSHC